MKAIVYDGFGDTSVLKLTETSAPILKPHQIRISVKNSGLNRADLSQRLGKYPPPPGESAIPGLEVSGTVSEVSPESANTFRLGDKVMALLAGGGYATEVTIDSGLVMPLLPNLSFEQGAAIPEAFITAHHNLFHLGGFKAGDGVLIHAGASGVGTSALQLLKGVAARVFVTVGEPAKAEACRRLGAVPVLYKEESFEKRILQETAGKGVDLILDPVGAGYLASNLAVLAIGGRVIHIGTMGGRQAELDLGILMQKRARLIGSTLRALPLFEKQQAVTRFFNLAKEPLLRGEFSPLIAKVFPATEAAAAQTYLEKNQNIGKVILSW